jgi:tetratricopeptide (TPR) repeat protein
MISTNGTVKLTDFGIARPAEASLHTMEGNIAGTMHYLSPEQMDGGKVDNRSDIYSFGTILYEMLTGVKTFPQGSITELMKQKSLNKFKSLNEFGFSINADLVKIILRCLKLTPDKRYQHTQDLVNDLHKLNESLTKLTPKNILKNYYDGIKTVINTDSGKSKTRRFFDILRMPITPDKPKTPESTEMPEPEDINDEQASAVIPDESKIETPVETAKTAEPAFEPVPLAIPDNPTATEPAVKPAAVEPSEKPTPVKTPDKPIAAKPLERPQKVNCSAEPAPPKKQAAVKASYLSAIAEKLKRAGKSTAAAVSTKSRQMIITVSQWKQAISKRSLRAILIASLLLLTVSLLSYITITIIMAASAQMDTSISAAAAADTTAEVEVLADTVPPPQAKTTVRAASPSKVAATVPATTESTRAAPVPAVTDSSVSDTAVTPSPIADARITNTKIEIQYFNEAIAAGIAKQWDKAIEILEQDGKFTHINSLRTLGLFNAYIESQKFDKAQAIMDTTSLTQDAYFLMCAGKFWYYQKNHDKAERYFESSLTGKSVMNTRNVLPSAALFFIADIRHARFKTTPTPSNRSAALEAWRKVRSAYTTTPNDPRAKRAEREISELSTESY